MKADQLIQHLVSITTELPVTGGAGLTVSVSFRPGLNILSGANGTGKTQLLQAIKQGRGQLVYNPPSGLRSYAISPKRNAERRAQDQLVQQLRQQSRDHERYVAEGINIQLQDNVFQNYSSFGELFFLLFEQESKDGEKRIDHMHAIACELQQVVQKIFPSYSFHAEWNSQLGAPTGYLMKNGGVKVPLDKTSLGEQEALSLAANMYAMRDKIDLFLIDEPEVHLNWQVERSLFDFLNWFSDEYKKQVIVVTHSRVVFLAPYLEKTQFVKWVDNTLHVVSKPDSEIVSLLSGEAIQIVKLGGTNCKTVFVEDKSHELVVNALVEILKAEVSVVKCGNSSNVVSLNRASIRDDGWRECLFLIDKDGQGKPKNTDNSLVQTKEYCIENFCFSVSHLATIFSKPECQIQTILLESIKETKEKLFGSGKGLSFLVERLLPNDINDDLFNDLDCSVLLPKLCAKNNVTEQVLICKMVAKLHEHKQLKERFPNELIDFISVEMT